MHVPGPMGISIELEDLHAKWERGRRVERVEGGIIIAGGGCIGLSWAVFPRGAAFANMARALFLGARVSKNKGYLQ